MKIHNGIDEEPEKLTRMVHQNTQRLAKIVDDILDAARAQSPAGDLTSIHLSLNPAIQRICSEWSAQNHCQQRLACSLADEPVFVQFDGDHLCRVLVNLLDNARRFPMTKRIASKCQPTPHTTATLVRVANAATESEEATPSIWPPQTH